MRPPMNKPWKAPETLLRGTGLGRWLLASVLIALGPTLVGCDSSRPPVPRNPIARHYARLEGTRIVNAAVEAHGGYDIWQHKADVRFEITDRWRGLAGRWTLVFLVAGIACG